MRHRTQACWRAHGRLGLLLLSLTLGWPLSLALAQSGTDLERQPELETGEARRLGPGGPTQLELNPVIVPPQAERRRLSELREALSPTLEPPAQIRIRALEGFLDYDEEDQMIYGPGRTRIQYGEYLLEADRVILDARLREVQAEGNVMLKLKNETLYGDSLRYSFDDGEGVAYGVRGQHEALYFQAAKPVKGQEHVPQMQRLSKQQSIFRNTNVTTCDFKIPHYFVRGREVVLFQSDKIFFRGATLHVMGAPVFYLPFYSRSLRGGSPWFTQFGTGDRTGFRVRLGYRFRQVLEEPSLTDDKVYELRQSDVADVFVDYLTEVGFGAGLDYRYKWEFGKHKGELNLYGINDKENRVVGDREDPFNPLTPTAQRFDTFDEQSRYRAAWKHRTQLTDRVHWLVNADWFSDPGVFYDVLDFFAEDPAQREREMTRRARTELAYRNDAYILRMVGEFKDRIGLDRYEDFSNQRDNDRIWDLNPFQSLANDDNLDGFSRRRWGRVTQKIQADLVTRMLPLGLRPWYYEAEAHTYYALDKGFNAVNDEDDANVPGAEFYQRVTRQWKLSPRYTLLTALGVGVGGAEHNDNFGIDLDRDPPWYYPLLTPKPPNFPLTVDGLTFTDGRGSFLVGEREQNYRDIKTAYGWADGLVRLNARFTDALTGVIDYRYRRTSTDFIGDWYAHTGNYTFYEDLYNYKVREHWIEPQLYYRLARPLLALYARLGHNLESGGELFPNEEIGNYMAGYQWSNQRGTLVNNGGGGIRERQVFDPTDPEETTRRRFYVSDALSYSPIHQRWYAKANVSHSRSLSGQVERDSASRLTFFTDEDPDTQARITYGRELGPKWNTELYTNWDQQVSGFKEISWLLKRDLHDAEALVRVTMKNDDTNNSRNSRDDKSSTLDYRFGFRIKLPNNATLFGADRITTAKDRAREPALSY